MGEPGEEAVRCCTLNFYLKTVETLHMLYIQQNYATVQGSFFNTLCFPGLDR